MTRYIPFHSTRNRILPAGQDGSTGILCCTPELALLEIVAHLNPAVILRLHLLVLDIPDVAQVVLLDELPANWLPKIPS